MGVGTLGFLKGFSSTQLDSIDKREEAQREKDKVEMLERLRREGEQIAFNREQADRDAAVDDKLTQYDYANGTVTFFNGKNKELSKRPMTQAELDAYKAKEELEKLTLEGKRLDNDNTRARTATEGLQQANYRSMIADRAREAKQRSLDSSEKEQVDTVSDPYLVGKELLSMRPGLVKSLNDLGVDPALVDEAAASAAREAITNPAYTSQETRIRAALQKLDARLNQLKTPMNSRTNPVYKNMYRLDVPAKDSNAYNL